MIYEIIVYCLEKEMILFYGTGNLSSLTPKIWELIPETLKDETELSQFKTKIKTWTTSQYQCRLCTKYIVFILISFKLFLCISFTILFNARVLYLFMR